MQKLNILTLSLNNILSEIMKLSGGFSVFSTSDGTTIQISSDEILDKIDGDLYIEERFECEYPYKISKTVNGVKFFVLSK